MAAFVLSKWYLDCLTAAGDASIAYTGAVHWGPVRLHYSSLLESTDGNVSLKHSLRPQPPPHVNSGSLHWRSAALELNGEWCPASQELRNTLFASEAGSIDWHCLMPRAQVRLGRRCGLGYVEHIHMTVAPWKIPIQTLRWGRFATPSDWIVWIDWQGEFMRRLVYRNGREIAASLLEDDEIRFEDGARLVLDRSFVLREGPLGATALSAIPGVRDTFPARLLLVRECKWRSRARLEHPGRPAVEAWSIHERVTWPE